MIWEGDFNQRDEFFKLKVNWVRDDGDNDGDNNGIAERSTIVGFPWNVHSFQSAEESDNLDLHNSSNEENDSDDDDESDSSERGDLDTSSSSSDDEIVSNSSKDDIEGKMNLRYAVGSIALLN